MKTHRLNSLKALYVFLVAMLMTAIIGPVVSAATLSSPSLLLGDPRPSTSSSYTFSGSGFTTATTIRCIDVILNTQADGGGSAPTGITTTSSTLSSSSLITAGSWSVDNGSNGRLRITIAGGETPAASGNVVWGNITNGSTVATTYFALFTSYTDASCTGGNEVDQATAAFIYKDGELIQLTIDPTLTFTCSGVAASQSVNGATTNVTSTASGVNYQNNVTSSTNGISAHDLNVSTNATNGYTVYIRHTGQLTNGSDTIANHTGTNAAPTSFPAAGTEAWGYTTEDSTLDPTADRFTNPGNLWAGFTTSNEIVINNTGATSGTETTRVGHQVGVSTTTPAGTYQTTVIYTVASTY
ncbi:hypothetical protein KDA00_02255 [Candidatus Saccharibacteria bacterium]|nr:hypothetical protein [Candidatus Saccharibacteria bacterium]